MLRFLPLTALVAFLAVASIDVRSAGRISEEEAAIRRQIAAIDANGNRDHSLTDVIFWSGAYKRPVIGREDDKPKQRAGEGGISDRADNSEKITTTPQRIIVANNKDLAYEYSTFVLAFDTKGGKHIKFDGATLRVWQKQDGQWKQAAIFARGYDK